MFVSVRSFCVRLFSLTVVLLGFFGLLLRPSVGVQAAYSGLSLCANAIVPTLFPFFVFSALLISLGFTDVLGKVFEPVMRPLFRLPGVCAAAFALGLLSGFPVGAKTAIALYENGQCSRTDAERMLSFCNNAGPAFVLGTVGIGIWNSSAVGWLLWLAQVFASVVTGMLFCRLPRKEHFRGSPIKKQGTGKPFLSAFADAVRSSAWNVIAICAFVVFFSVVTALLVSYGAIPWLAAVLDRLLPPDATFFSDLLTGALEMTSGVRLFGQADSVRENLTVTGALLGWAGLSVHLQVLSFVSDSDLSARPYLLGKAVQTVLAAVLTYLLSFLFPLDSLEVFSGYGGLTTTPDLSVMKIFLISVLFLVLFFTILLFMVRYALFDGKRT